MLKRRCRLSIGLALAAAALAAAGCSGPAEPPAAPPSPAPPVAGTAGDAAPAPDLVVNEKARTVSVPAVVVEQGQYLELKGAIEYVLVAKGGKRYETLFETERPAAEIHAALTRIGLGRGVPATADDPPRGQRVNLLVEVDSGGRTARRPVSDFLLDKNTGQPVPAGPWVYTGSSEAVDPDTGRPMLAASLTQSIVGLQVGDPSPLVQNPRPESRRENTYRANVQALPPVGTAVRVVFERPAASAAAGVAKVTAAESAEKAESMRLTEAILHRVSADWLKRRLRATSSRKNTGAGRSGGGRRRREGR